MNTYLLGKEIKTPYNSNKVLDMMPPSVSAPKPSATFKPSLTTYNIPVTNPSVAMKKQTSVISMDTKQPVSMTNQIATISMDLKPPIAMPIQTHPTQTKQQVAIPIQPHIAKMEKPIIITPLPHIVMEHQAQHEPVCPDIKKDLDEIKKKLNKIEEHETTDKSVFIPQSSDAGLLLAKQAGLNPNKLISQYQLEKSKFVVNREYFDSEQTCTKICDTVVDKITYANLVLLLVLVFFIYLMKN
jgi:hypothetical protein